MSNGQVTESRQQATAARAQDMAALTPRVDVLEDETGITLYADLPGVSKDALEVKVEGDSLQIEGAISAAAPQGMEATYAEIRTPRFRRAFTLSRELDASRIEASLKDGVLKLRIPKSAEAQPKRIAVKVA
ncbi:MAG TPA: Hsp20/alpha crystallin family protein [Burkholderiaceae bacterium]|jgi:HSP20 family molecular chaperone IbpA|nr:Hsp20/alpha crystallin family protein [Burkholderiaceae bacterium]